ncbi:hypothetical protein M569_03023, partial [Genlisea aurea]
MVILILIASLLVQSSLASASRFLRHVKPCETFHIDYSDGPGPIHELFYIDGKSVDLLSFCGALTVSYERHCFRGESIVNRYCHSLGMLYIGRKLLTPGVEEGYAASVKNDGDVIFEPKMLAMAVPIFLLCGCALMCPCFQARKRDEDHNENSVYSMSTPELNAAFEKIPGSPLRVPPSPLRMPPSPLRVPPSPTRLSMSSPKINRLASVHLDISQVSKVTQNFSPLLLIGEGKFGAVYKAELPDGQIVAIKRARKKQHLDALRAEFRSEVDLLAKIDHKNLVKLLGYIEKGDERMIITEYVPNGTLREHLDGLKPNKLDFEQRLEIAIDIADGLTYLHFYAGKQIIHRDIKSSNVLLTESLRAKVADFGCAKLGDDSDKTHISTKVKGTLGYVDPEYMRTYQLNTKSDVYSFGVLLLEILTGRRPFDLGRTSDERVNVQWVYRKYRAGKIMETVDPEMTKTNAAPADERILMKVFALALRCAAPTRVNRPDMKSVGEQLWGIRMEYLNGRR